MNLALSGRSRAADHRVELFVAVELRREGAPPESFRVLPRASLGVPDALDRHVRPGTRNPDMGLQVPAPGLGSRRRLGLTHGKPHADRYSYID